MTGSRVAPDLLSTSENVMFARTLANRLLRGLTSNADSTRRPGATTAYKTRITRRIRERVTSAECESPYTNVMCKVHSCNGMS